MGFIGIPDDTKRLIFGLNPEIRNDLDIFSRTENMSLNDIFRDAFYVYKLIHSEAKKGSIIKIHRQDNTFADITNYPHS